MKIAVGSDHRGFDAKRRILPALRKFDCTVIDFGCDNTNSVDYPDYAIPAAQAVARGECQLGILFDGSGIGMCVAANKVRGIRAALVHDEITARRAREHNHCNILCLGTDLLSEDQIRLVIEIFLTASESDGRHARRIAKLQEFEAQHLSLPAASLPTPIHLTQLPVAD